MEDVLKQSGGDNGAGLKRTIYFALAEDVDTWSALGASPSTYEDLVTLATGFTMKSTKQFHQFEADVRKNSLESLAAGERGSKTAINRLEIVRAKFTRQVAGFLETHKNDEMVFLCEDLNGNLRQLGTDDLPATIEDFNIPSGAEVSDEKNVKITVESVGKIAPFYGTEAAPLTVPLTPAA